MRNGRLTIEADFSCPEYALEDCLKASGIAARALGDTVFLAKGMASNLTVTLTEEGRRTPVRVA
jgi:hypothetical protein